jgi:hypothetical protein
MKKIFIAAGIVLTVVVIVVATVFVTLELQKDDEPGRVPPSEMKYEIIQCALFHGVDQCGKSGADAAKKNGIKRP